MAISVFSESPNGLARLPSRFPDVPNRLDRRDSLFCEKTPTTESAAAAVAAAAALFARPKTPPVTLISAAAGEAPRDFAANSVALSSTALLANAAAPDDALKKMVLEPT